jgi:hypothetical protein
VVGVVGSGERSLPGEEQATNGKAIINPVQTIQTYVLMVTSSFPQIAIDCAQT